MQSYKKLCGLMLCALSTSGFVVPAFGAASEVMTSRATVQDGQVTKKAQGGKKKEKKKKVGMVQSAVQRAQQFGANARDAVASLVRNHTKVVAAVATAAAGAGSVYAWNKNKTTGVSSKSKDASSFAKSSSYVKTSEDRSSDKCMQEADAIIAQKVAEGCSLADAQALAATEMLSKADAQVEALKQQVKASEDKMKLAQANARNDVRRVQGQSTRKAQAAARRHAGQVKNLKAKHEAETATHVEVHRQALGDMTAELHEAVTELDRVRQRLAIAEFEKQHCQERLEDARGWEKSAEKHSRASQVRCERVEHMLHEKDEEADFCDLTIAQMDKRMNAMQNQLEQARYMHGEDRAVIGMLNEALDTLRREKKELEAEADAGIVAKLEACQRLKKMSMDLDTLERHCKGFEDLSAERTQERDDERAGRLSAERARDVEQQVAAMWYEQAARCKGDAVTAEHLLAQKSQEVAGITRAAEEAQRLAEHALQVANREKAEASFRMGALTEQVNEANYVNKALKQGWNQEKLARENAEATVREAKRLEAMTVERVAALKQKKSLQQLELSTQIEECKSRLLRAVQRANEADTKAIELVRALEQEQESVQRLTELRAESIAAFEQVQGENEGLVNRVAAAETTIQQLLAMSDKSRVTLEEFMSKKKEHERQLKADLKIAREDKLAADAKVREADRLANEVVQRVAELQDKYSQQLEVREREADEKVRLAEQEMYDYASQYDMVAGREDQLQQELAQEQATVKTMNTKLGELCEKLNAKYSEQEQLMYYYQAYASRVAELEAAVEESRGQLKEQENIGRQLRQAIAEKDVVVQRLLALKGAAGSHPLGCNRASSEEDQKDQAEVRQEDSVDGDNLNHLQNKIFGLIRKYPNSQLAKVHAGGASAAPVVPQEQEPRGELLDRIGDGDGICAWDNTPVSTPRNDKVLPVITPAVVPTFGKQIGARSTRKHLRTQAERDAVAGRQASAEKRHLDNIGDRRKEEKKRGANSAFPQHQFSARQTNYPVGFGSPRANSAR